MEILNINSNKGVLTVKWSNLDCLVSYSTLQAGFFFDDIADVKWSDKNRFIPLHKKNFHKWHQLNWDQREALSTFDIKDGSKIVDIGCGTAVIDLLLYSYIPNSQFYLVDKQEDWPKDLNILDVYYAEDHPFYHSWDVVTDAINTSGFDKNKFTFLSPESEFPEDADLIMSSASWCFHYSKDQYWSRVLKSLKIGGKLFLDIRLLPERDIINEISEEFKSIPAMIKIPQVPEYLDITPNVTPGVLGYRCLWTRNN